MKTFKLVLAIVLTYAFFKGPIVMFVNDFSRYGWEYNLGMFLGILALGWLIIYLYKSALKKTNTDKDSER